PGPSGTSRPDGQTASIMAAAEMAVLRCRELAGSRILTTRDTCPECLKPAQDVQKHLVASVLGADVIAQVKAADSSTLVQGGADGFRSWLCGREVPEEQAAALAQMVESWSARTLYESSFSLPSGFEAHVERVNEYAV